MKKYIGLVLALLVLAGLAGCRLAPPAQPPQALQTAPPADVQVIDAFRPVETPEAPAAPDATAPAVPDRDGYYYDVDGVVLYLDTYGCLPGNFITKDEARALGWEGGSVEKYRAGAAIGGDRFGNREGILPDGSYTECDIGTLGAAGRGAERLVFSDDGRYYYTADHYESYTELFVQGGEVIRR